MRQKLFHAAATRIIESRSVNAALGCLPFFGQAEGWGGWGKRRIDDAVIDELATCGANIGRYAVHHRLHRAVRRPGSSGLELIYPNGLDRTDMPRMPAGHGTVAVVTALRRRHSQQSATL